VQIEEVYVRVDRTFQLTDKMKTVQVLYSCCSNVEYRSFEGK